MKLRRRNLWPSILPLCSRSKKSATQFCIFPKVKSAGHGLGNTPVYLNVYDLTSINGYIRWAGLGVFHSAVEVHGVEYAFGAHDFPATGVFEGEPRQCPGFKFRKSIFMGTTHLNSQEIREFVESQAVRYNGDTYHLIVKNCNHFSEDICYKLTGHRIPKWVNRLAKIGSICHCVLPKALKASAVRHNPNIVGNDSGDEGLRCFFSCLPALAMLQKEISLSSLFMHSSSKGCLPSWKLKRSKRGSLKEG